MKFHAIINIKLTRPLVVKVSAMFVRSFILCRQESSLLWTPALRPYSGPVRLPRERKGIGRCVLRVSNARKRIVKQE